MPVSTGSPRRAGRLAAAALLATASLGATSAGPDPVADLRQDLLRIIGAPGWRSAEWSVLAVSLDRGDTLFSEGATIPLSPASNMKLVTTAAAMEILGPEYRYPTFVLTSGRIENGTLYGDVILYGTGDPSISDRFYTSASSVLDSLAGELIGLGIEAVQGDVVGDGTFFEGPLLGADWDSRDLNDWFAAPVSALTANENVIRIRVQAANYAGLRPVVETVPPHADVDLLNSALTVDGGPSSPLRMGRPHPMSPILVEGEMRVGAPDAWREITVAEPERFAAALFRDALEARGIAVRGRVGSVGSAGHSAVTGRKVWAPAIAGGTAPRVLATHLSRPLGELISVVNKRSHNLYAEALLKTMGRTVSGLGSYEGGADAAESFLRTSVGLESGSVGIVDGSGLSKTNRASAQAFVQLLDHMTRSDAWEGFWASLPEAGNRRELARMYRTPASGNLRAKTGTIDRVSALSGIVRSASGERIAFSILSNNVPSTSRAKQIEDRIGALLAAFDRAAVVAPSTAPASAR